MKAFLSTNVYDAAIQRAVEAYKAGHRIVVAFSAGKDSTCALEVAITAAKITGNLPVEAWMQDAEIMYPGTYEYAERVANRKEVKFHWLISGEASLNVFNRKNPYYWVFDDRLKPSEWLRQPPAFAKWTSQKDLYNVVNPESFPPPEGKLLYVLMGVRGSESRRRNMMIHQSGGALSGMGKVKGSDIDRSLERHFRPIYDWTTKDVWLAIKENGWDYNDAYNVMSRFGVKREQQRIAPVTMTTHGIPLLKIASRAWPEWFDRLCIRLPGVRLGALYGRTAIAPIRRNGETWEVAYQRLCIDEAPEWIAKRAIIYRDVVNKMHSAHSKDPVMEIAPCPTCPVGRMSWKGMTEDLYLGDPFLLNVGATGIIPMGYLEPEDMRPGSGTFAGKPTF